MLNPENYLDKVEFTTGHEPRCACVLLLDTSNSMKGDRIAKLNDGYKLFINTLKKDPLATLRVEISVITFGGKVKTMQEFTNVDRIRVTPFESDGSTPMGEAITTAIAKVNDRKKIYKTHGKRYYRPWILMITDGEPTDAWQSAATLVHQQEKEKKLTFFAVGVDGAKTDILKQISVRPPRHLKGLKFAEMFEWLSSSLSAVSDSNPGDEPQIASTDDWATVPT